jgi:hypothetical protein
MLPRRGLALQSRAIVAHSFRASRRLNRRPVDLRSLFGRAGSSLQVLRLDHKKSRSADGQSAFLMPRRGLEPPRPCEH